MPERARYRARVHRWAGSGTASEPACRIPVRPRGGSGRATPTSSVRPRSSHRHPADDANPRHRGAPVATPRKMPWTTDTHNAAAAPRNAHRNVPERARYRARVHRWAGSGTASEPACRIPVRPRGGSGRATRVGRRPEHRGGQPGLSRAHPRRYAPRHRAGPDHPRWS
ncbi:Uncharacterised protein [Mycobacteroides abscessus subsp. massiliense]|nr:Uncharacterised protein [Mycobacteroides abscessus subsp. massiliense]